jgi:hypothetical protein
MPVRQANLPQRHRVGYEVSYVAPRAVKSVEQNSFWRRTRAEARVGSLTFWGGIAWAVQIATKNGANPFRVLLTPGPLEVCAVGLLIWLHSKWRRSVRVD